MKAQFEVLSPEGFGIEMDSNYTTIEQAKEALKKFVKRFEMQGYYSTIKDGERYKMPISEIEQNCKIVKL